MNNNFKTVNWTVLFSRTGQEIADICLALGVRPNRIITTVPTEKWSTSLYNIMMSENRDNYVIANIDKQNAKNVDTLKQVLGSSSNLITLHGWLYLIPDEICNSNDYNIYNGHPGNILKYPELKGKDPQLKAFQRKLHQGNGSIVHKVIPEVDSGKIVSECYMEFSEDYSDGSQIDIELSAASTYEYLRYTSLQAWLKFFYMNWNELCDESDKEYRLFNALNEYKEQRAE